MSSRTRRQTISLSAFLILLMSLAVPAVADEAGQHQWGPDNPQGNFLGAEHLPCDGTLHWVFNPGGNHDVTSATLSVEGDDEVYIDQKPQANNFHFFTPGTDVDTDTEVVVSFEGQLGEGQATLTISECIDEEVVEEEEGAVRVAKEATGEGDVPEEDFEFTLSCEEGDHAFSVAAGEESAPVTQAGGFTNCTVEEIVDHGADEVSWRVEDNGTVAEGSGNTTDTFDVPAGATVVVTFTNVFDVEEVVEEEEGAVRVAKEATGEGDVPEEDFEFTLSCEEGDHAFSVAAGEESAPVTQAGGFTNCTVEEIVDHGADEVSWRVEDNGTVAEGSGNTTDTFDVPAGATVVVTFTNVFDVEVLGVVIEREVVEVPAVVEVEVLDVVLEAVAEQVLPVTGSDDARKLLLISLLMLALGGVLVRETQRDRGADRGRP